MNKQINKIIADCLSAYPTDLTTFLVENESDTKNFLRTMFDEVLEFKKKKEIRDELLLVEEKEKVELIEKSLAYFPIQNRTVTLKGELTKLSLITSSLQRKGYRIKGIQYLIEILDKAGLLEGEESYNSMDTSDIILFKETPRELGFKRSPNSERLLEKTPRRFLIVSEILFFINSILLKESKVVDTEPDFKSFERNQSLTFFLDEQLELSFGGLRIELKFKIDSFIKRVDFYLRFAKDAYKIWLDNPVVLAYGRDQESKKLLKAIFGDEMIEPKDANYFEEIFKPKPIQK